MAVIACSRCGAQYDASQLQPGAQFACASCGNIVQFGAAKPAPRQAGARSTVAGARKTQRMPGGKASPGARKTQQMRGSAGGRATGNFPGRAPAGSGQTRSYAPPAKKSKTGLIVGLSIGGVVAIALIVVVVLAASGSSFTPTEEALLAKVMAGSTLSESEIKQAEILEPRVPKENKTIFGQNIGKAKVHLQNEQKREMEAKKNAAIDAATSQIQKVAQDFYAALKASDIHAMAGLIDASRYHNNMLGKGGPDGVSTEWKTPATWRGEAYYDEARRKYDWKAIEAYGPSELTSVGLEHLAKLYGKGGLDLIIDQTDGRVNAYGNPPDGKGDGDDRYLGKATFKLKGAEDLKIDIRGLWNGPAKVDMIYDKTAKSLVEAFQLETIRKGNESNELGEGGEQPSPNGTETHSGSNPTGHETVQPVDGATPGLPLVKKWNRSDKVDDTKAKEMIDSAQLRKAIDTLLKGYSVNEYTKFLIEASDRDKLYSIGACVDILNNAARQGERKADEVMPNIASYITGALVEWEFADDSGDYRLTEEWVDALSFKRGVSSALEMAWYYRQAYDELKSQIEFEEKR